jgi:histone H3/H4
MQDELVPRDAEACAGKRERRERSVGSARRLLRRELVREELCKLLRIAELLHTAFRDVVRGLGEDARTLSAANPDASELISELVEICHASTASTARENCFHSSRRTVSASRPDRVIR